MKPPVIAGWTLLGLETLCVLMLALQQNMGDDAAGRGMALGFAMLLAPVVLGAGALLWWGSRGGPALAWWAGFCIVAAPVAWTAIDVSLGLLRQAERGVWRAQQGRFDDARLTALARAIDADDHAALQRLLADGTPDWTARDRWGRTLLGHAIDRALADDVATARLQCVQLLLQAGAPPAVDALAAAPGMGSVSAHQLVYHLYGVHNPNALAMLDMVLAAGASPHVLDEDGRPLYFSTYTTLPALEILARHGADFTQRDTRSDRLQHTVLMNAVSMQAWAEALFFLRHGVPPGHVAPDGQSLHTILAEVDPPGSAYTGDDARAHDEFIAALGAGPAAPAVPR